MPHGHMETNDTSGAHVQNKLYVIISEQLMVRYMTRPLQEILILCSAWVLQHLYSGKRCFYLAETRLFQLAVNMDRFIQRRKATEHFLEVLYPCSCDLY